MADAMPNGPYPKLLLDLATQQGAMREKLEEVVRSIEDMRAEQKANSFTRKDLILAALSSVGVFAVLGTGLFFLIGTVVQPVSQELHSFQTEINERLRQQDEVNGERMKAQLEAIQANRAVNIEQDKEINEIRLSAAANAGRMDRSGAPR